MKVIRWTCDFETTTDINDCRVWAFAICRIGEPENIEFANNIDSAMKLIFKRKCSKFYFHNLNFDGEFIINWLFRNGFTYVEDKKELTNNSFTCLISGAGKFYSMSIKIANEVYEILDSLKIIPFSVEKIAKGFGLPINKLELDYDEYRPEGHKLTKLEMDYIAHDVQILAMALDVLFREGHIKMTQGSNALADYKRLITTKLFKRWYPELECDEYIRKSYRGGVTMANKTYIGETVGEGIVLDVNSLYPYVMKSRLLPYGEPAYYEGRYTPDEYYPLYVQMFSCCFYVKDGYLPTVQLKKNLLFLPTEYIEDSGPEPVVLVMTNVDIKLFFEHYHVYNIEWISGYKFRGSTSLFSGYVDKWYERKERATREGNEAIRTLSKLMMNALYGKFGTNKNVTNKHPWLDNGVVRYITKEGPDKKTVYVAAASFITAYARDLTLRSAQSCYDRFLYCDTDSLHLLGTNYPDNLDIHPTRLGAWKHEATFTRAKYLRAKTYVEEINGKLDIKCAGMPPACYGEVTFDNFKIGTSYGGKLKPKHVVGGIVLADEAFTIKG